MIYEANPKRRQDELNRPLVHGLQRTRWMSNDNGEGSSNHFVEHNEMQYTKLSNCLILYGQDTLSNVKGTT
jgi:hypothetical protein